MIRGNKKKKFVRKNKTDKKNKTKEKPKFKRAKKAPKMPNQFLGGFLPFPPKECPKKDHILLCYGITWIDLSICHWCNNIKQCDTRIEHLQKLKDARKEYFSKFKKEAEYEPI